MNNNYNLTRGTHKRWVLQRFFLGICTLFLSLQLQAQTFCTSCNGTNGACAYPSITNNSNLNASCTGMDILFVIDESGSTNGFQTNIEDAVMTFLESLKCVGVNMAVIEFNSTARYVRQNYTLVDDNFVAGMQEYFDDDLSSSWTNQIFEPYDQDSDGDTDNCTNNNAFCATNWQAAFLAADALATPDLLLFFTDGLPTAYSTGSNPSFGGNYSICGNGASTQRPEIVNAMKLSNKLKGEGTHIFALGIGAFNASNQIQLERISGNDQYIPNTSSTIRNADFATDSFEQLAECLATFADDLCEFDSDVTASDGCPGDNDGELQIEIPQNLLPVSYSYDGPGGNDGNGTSNSSPITISNLPAGDYEISVEISLGSNCTRTETFFETIGSQTCSGTPTINCPAGVTYGCNPTDNNGDDLPDAIPDPADEIVAGNITGNNPNCDVIITHDGDSQIMQDPNDDCLYYIIRTYRVNNKCGSGTNICTQRFEWTISDLSLSACPADVDLDGCTDQTTLDNEWGDWIAGLNGMATNGGCNTTLTFDPPISTLVKPSICPSTPYNQLVTITAKDDCEELSCTTSFKLGMYANNLSLDDCPDDPNLDGCTPDVDISTAWNTWITALGDLEASGGCSPAVTYDPPLSTLVQPGECAGADQVISVKVIAKDLCGMEECTATFTLKAAPTDLALDACPGVVELDGCTTDAAVTTAWDTWIQALEDMNATGGCSPVVSYDPPLDQLVQPTQCGPLDQVVNVKVTATDLCDSKECSTSFTLKAYPDDLSLSACPEEVLAGCSTQEEINAAFEAWIDDIEGMTIGGSCSPTLKYEPALSTLVAPTQCIGTDKVVKVMIMDLCESISCEATFTLEAPPTSPTLDACPSDPNLDGCTADAAIASAWDTWITALEDMSASGGCSPEVTYDPPLDQLVQPEQCGISQQQVSVKVTLTDLCGSTDCTATFTVGAYPGDLVLDACPTPVELDGCTADAAVETAWDTWIASLEAMQSSGSCNSTVSYDPPLDELVQPTECGDVDQVITVKVTATDLCDSKECSTSFTLKAYPGDLVLDACPTPVELDGCTADAAVGTAWDAWIASLEAMQSSGSCNSSVSYDPPLDELVQPTECGDADQVITVKVTATDLCDSKECSTSFTLKAYPGDLVLDACPTPVELDGCTADAAVGTAWDTWIASLEAMKSSGSCNSSVSYDPPLDELVQPTQCGDEDQVITVKVTATDLCDSKECSTSFTLKAYPGDLVLDACPTPVELDGCTADAAVGTAWDAWIASLEAMQSSGSCNSSVSYDPPLDELVQPTQCGDEDQVITVKVTATDLCDSKECSTSFTLKAYPGDLVLDACPTPVELDGCTADAAVETAWDTWIASLEAMKSSGSCNSTVSYDPPLDELVQPTECGDIDQVITVKVTATDLCDSKECSTSFTLKAYPGDLVLDACPTPVELDGCTADAAVETAWDTWIASLEAMQSSGSCNSTVSYDPPLDELVQPTECGDVDQVITVKVTATDLCDSKECSTSFTLKAYPGDLVLDACPTPVELDGCTADAAVETAWDTWIASLEAMQSSGSCNSSVSYDPPLDELVQPTQCDDEDQVITVKVTATDLCDSKECSTSFTLKAYPGDLVLDACPTPVELDGCTADAAVETAWDTWIASLEAMQSSGSCNSSVSYDPPLDELVQPTQCGDEDQVITVKVTATDLCDSKECSTSFTLKAYPGDLVLDACPTPVELDGCTADAAVGTAWDAWIASLEAMQSSGSCNSTVSYDPPLDELVQPTQCGEEDQVITVKVTATDLCDSKECSTSFTLKAYPDDLTLSSCPTDEVSGCLSQDEIDEAFSAWIGDLEAMTTTGSCNPTISFDPPLDQLVSPEKCADEDQIIKVTVTSSDLCESISCEATFTLIVDTEAPEITHAWSQVEECGPGDDASFQAWLDNNGGATATDNCGNVHWSYEILNFDPGCCSTGEWEVKFIATDDCDNASSTIATFKIVDTTAPEISCPADVTDIPCGMPLPEPNVHAVHTSDNCVCTEGTPGECEVTEGCITVSGGSPTVNANGTVTYSFRVSSECSKDISNIAFSLPNGVTAISPADNSTYNGLLGNYNVENTTNNPFHSIKFESLGDPFNEGETEVFTFTLPAGVILDEFNIQVKAGQNRYDIWFGPDECEGEQLTGDNGVTVEWEGDVSNNASGCEGDPIIITRTYRATDACGNSAVCHQRFIYREDLVAPEITVEAADKTVECDGEGNERAFAAWLMRQGGAEAEDDCNELDWTYDVVGTDEGCGGTLIYTVTFTATDACENSSETTANFIIEDTTPPTIELAAANETVECDGAGNVAAFEAWLAEQGGAVAADICSGVSWTYAIDEEVDNCGLTKSYKVTFTATDDCDNSSETTAYFIIEDTTPPVITNEAADESVECDGEGNMEQFQEWLSLHGGATASDDCGNVSWSMVIEDKSESCGATGYMTVTFVATDECDNSSQTTATFTIVDTTAPDITTAAANKTVECDGEGNEAELQSWLDMHGGASAEDVCSDVTWTYQMSSEPGCGLTQVITVIFTATDDCNNSSETSATFTIEDTTDPVLDAPATADIACNDPLPTIEDAIAEDACGDVNVVGSIDPYEVDVCNGYQVTYRWTATDDCGNDTDVTSTFNVLPDTDAPVITPIHPALMGTPNGGTLPAIECNNADPDWNPFTLTAEAVDALDDCSGVTVTMTDELVEEGCGTSAGFVSKWICTWTATDACGNASSYSVYMLIVDTTPPVFDQDPADVTVACGEMPAMPEITAHDACSDVQISYSISAQPGECAGEKILLRTWIAEDACGNTSSISQRIYQVDSEAPTIILRDELADYQNGQDVYVDCASFNDYIFLENKARAADDCDTDPSISYDFKIFPPVNNCEAKGYTRKLEVEWTATDGCGNASTFELTIYGVDETAPVFDEAPSVICATSDAIPAASGVTATDACSDVSISVSDDGGADCGDGAVITRTWIAEDACGNVAEFVQQIVLDDSTAPTISVDHPAFEGATAGDEVSIEADCANGDEFGLPDLSALVAVNDGCATMDTPTVVLGLLEEGSCEAGFLYLVRMTITATDACGNEASADYTLRVQDTSGPVFGEAASELTLDCSEAFPTPIAIDACGGLVELSVTNDGNFDVCNAADDPLVRTWVATDQCGNSTTFVQTIYVVDTTPPVFIGIPDDECMEDGVIPEVPLVTAVDGCNETPAEVFYEQTVEDGDCGQVIVRTWMTWDACDNKDTVVQRIIEEDTTPPTIAFSHPDLDQLENGATVESNCVNFQEDHEPEYDASAVSVADNCSDDIDVAFSYELVASGSCQTDGYVGRYKFTWIATDPCGNSASIELYVNAVDVTPPAIFERPASVINLYCDQAIPAPMELLAVDACSGVTVDFVEETTYPSPGMTAIGRTWTATDDCGNAETVTQWIKIQDYQLECNFLNYENEVSCGSDDNTITVAVTGGTAPYTYNWDLVDCDGIMVEGMDSQTLTFIAGFTPLNFVVEVTDANGCSTTCTLTVPCKKDKGNRPSQGVGVGIGNGNANGNGNGNGHGRPGGNLVIYPNPSTGTYYLEFEEYFDQPAKVIVRNLVGQHVKTTKLDEIPTEAIELDLQELPDGMYTVTIEVDGIITAIHKVIKEQ